jgi:putative redox protein
MNYKFEKPIYGKIGTEKYRCSIEWRNGKFISDEPEEAGGKSSGPDPHTLFLSSLVACQVITLRMYADRKGWDIDEIAINANLYMETLENKITTVIECEFIFPGTASKEQKDRLLTIAKHCPISKILENDVKVLTI